MKNITILGATGSIGLNTLEVIKIHPNKYNVFALSAKNNWQVMLSLCNLHKPEYVVMTNSNAAKKLRGAARCALWAALRVVVMRYNVV